MRYYLDTEFDGFGGPLISLALVREDGAYRYLLTHHQALDPWVVQNVVPILDAGSPNWVESTPRELAMNIAEFLKDDPDPVIISDWPADIRHFCELIEFPMGQMAPITNLRFELHRVDAYPTTLPDAVQHNAWWDAMALRHLLTASLHAA